jgi:Protein of unknown function (DUF3775)
VVRSPDSLRALNQRLRLDPPDEEMRSVLEDRPDDPLRQELAAFISAMSFDERVDLVTLTWIGRGDGTLANWAELRDLACSTSTSSAPPS